MVSRKRQLLFKAIAVVCLFYVAALSLGYLGEVGATINRSNANHSIAGRQISLTTTRGRIKCVLRRLDLTCLPTKPLPSLTWAVDVWPLRAPEWRRSIWEFDFHKLPPAPGSPPTFLIACPIWLVTLPWMIVLVVWWRRRRSHRREEVQGFTVLNPAAS